MSGLEIGRPAGSLRQRHLEAVFGHSEPVHRNPLTAVLLDKYPDVVGLLDDTAVLFLIFGGNSTLFPTATAPFGIPTRSTQGC